MTSRCVGIELRAPCFVQLKAAAALCIHLYLQTSAGQYAAVGVYQLYLPAYRAGAIVYLYPICYVQSPGSPHRLLE